MLKHHQQGNSSNLNIQVSDSLEISKLKKKLALLALIIQASAVLVLIHISIHLERYIAGVGKTVFGKWQTYIRKWIVD